MLLTTAIAAGAGLAVAAVWPQSHARDNCQFLRWENKQLWPDGGGPPLPAGC